MNLIPYIIYTECSSDSIRWWFGD